MQASTFTDAALASLVCRPALLASVPGVLGEISRERAEDYASREVAALEVARAASERTRTSFALSAALRHSGLAVIAEVKRKSPSQGAIAELEPVAAAKAYERGGAAALSVLTEPRHFGGELEHLEAVSQAVSLPLLRKDFTVHPRQLIEAKSAGASAVLLIVAVLRKRVEGYLELAQALELDALVEVHDEAELELALKMGATIIGVNNRDLRTLEIDLENAPRLIRQAKDSGFRGLLVAESGYRTADELTVLEGLADAVLVGTSLAGSGDLETALKALTLRLRPG